MATAGAISGLITFEGEAPAAERIDMAEEPDCNDAYPGDGALTQHALVSSDGKLGNVFVYVKEGLGAGFPAPSQPAVLDQENCRYHPHIVGLQVDQPLSTTSTRSRASTAASTSASRRPGWRRRATSGWRR
jgi:hypothetical protein